MTANNRSGEGTLVMEDEFEKAKASPSETRIDFSGVTDLEIESLSIWAIDIWRRLRIIEKELDKWEGNNVDR